MCIETITKEDFDYLLMINYRQMKAGKIPSDSPTAILLGGQIGSGKTINYDIKYNELVRILSRYDEILFLLETIQKWYNREQLYVLNIFGGKNDYKGI